MVAGKQLHCDLNRFFLVYILSTVFTIEYVGTHLELKKFPTFSRPNEKLPTPLKVPKHNKKCSYQQSKRDASYFRKRQLSLFGSIFLIRPYDGLSDVGE